MIENYILKFFVLVTWFIHPGLLKKMYHFQPCEKEEMLLNKKHNGIMIYETQLDLRRKPADKKMAIFCKETPNGLR